MSQILYTLIPVLVGILSYFLLKEHFTLHKLFGSVIALSGVLLLIQQSITAQKTLTFGTFFGNMIILVAVFMWSFYIIFSKNLTKTYTPETTSFFSFIITTVLLFVISPIEWFFHPFVIDRITVIGLGSLFGVAIFSSAIMFYLKQIGIHRTTAFTASLFQYMAPLFASLTAIPILKEQPTIVLIIGGAFIIVGVFYATTFDTMKKYIKLPVLQ